MSARYNILGQNSSSELREAAKTLRAQQTPEEDILWKYLRAHRLNGWKFRRQQIIDRLIVDFYCHRAGLVIELDGGYHLDAEQQAYDHERDQVLADRGLHLLRIPNERIHTELDVVLAEIERLCEELAR